MRRRRELFRHELRGSSFARRLGLFAANNLVVTTIPFAVFPVVVFLAGSSVWASVALGQSLGGLATIGIEFGLAVSGPSAIAAAVGAEKKDLFAKLLAFRLILLVPVTALLLVVSSLVPGSFGIVVVAALAAELLALDAGWYFIGAEDPKSLMRYDTIPQAIVIVAGVVVALLFHNIWILLLAQVVASLVAVTLSAASILRGRGLRREDFSWGIFLANLRSQATAAGASATAGLYVSLPAVMIAAIIPSALAAFAAVQTVQKYLLSFVRPVIQVLQGWVPSRGADDLSNRTHRAVFSAIVLGVCTGLILMVVMRPLIALLTGSQIQISLPVTIFAGLTIAAIIASQVVGLACLPAFGLVRQVFYSTAIGAVVGLGTFWLSALLWGVAGAWLALAVSEFVVLTYQLICLRTALRRLKGGDRSLRRPLGESS